MKYYKDSVKELLSRYFGSNPIPAMRCFRNDLLSPDDFPQIVPLRWQYADEWTIGFFQQEHFLQETVVTEDYIAYLGWGNSGKYACLMFMLQEDQLPFSINIPYAASLIRQWQAKGYRTQILCVTVYEEWHSNQKNFCITGPNIRHSTDCLYDLRTVGGRDILVYSCPDWWESRCQSLLLAACSGDSMEYECLFDPKASICKLLPNQAARSKASRSICLAEGIPAIKAWLEANGPLRLNFKPDSNGICRQFLTAGNLQLILHMSRANQIQRIDIPAAPAEDENLLFLPPPWKSLTNAIPILSSVWPLDPVKIHGFALGLRYSDGTLRNYYITSFEDRQIPQTLEWEGYTFSQAILASVKPDGQNGVLFCNGCHIPAHQLYYRGCRQLEPKRTDEILYENESVRLRAFCRIPSPLLPSYNWLPNLYLTLASVFEGPEEHQNTILSFSSVQALPDETFLVQSESTGKYGYIRKDGSWIAPPVYETAEALQGPLIRVSRLIGKEKKTLYITPKGQEIEFLSSGDAPIFSCGGYAFSLEKWEDPCPDPLLYYYYDVCLTPGKWSILNSQGDRIAESKYVYVDDTYFGECGYCVVARFVGDKLKWGLIDQNGVETIPCHYHGIYFRWGNAAIFWNESLGPLGLMDHKGNILAEPQFGYICEYDPQRRMITAGNNEYEMGAYSVELQRFITPVEFDDIDYYEHYMVCECSDSLRYRCFDYNGREILFDEQYRFSGEQDGLIKVTKEDLEGLIDLQGNTVLPTTIGDKRIVNTRYYRYGFLESGSCWQRPGLITLEGQQVLPERSWSIYMPDPSLILCCQTKAGEYSALSLYSSDGKQLLQGFGNWHWEKTEPILKLHTLLEETYVRIEPKETP